MPRKDCISFNTDKILERVDCSCHFTPEWSAGLCLSSTVMRSTVVFYLHFNAYSFHVFSIQSCHFYFHIKRFLLQGSSKSSKIVFNNDKRLRLAKSGVGLSLLFSIILDI